MSNRLNSMLFIYTSAFVGLMALYGFYGFWSDSEMWAVTVAKFLFESQPHQYDFSVKPLFNALNWLLFQIAFLFQIFPMYVGRAAAAFVTVFSIWSVYKISLAIAKDSRWAFLAVIFLVSSQIFLKQGARARSDLYAAALVLWAVYLILKKTSLDRRVSLLLLGLFLASISFTPKALYFWLFPLPLLWPALQLRKYAWQFAAAGAAMGLVLMASGGVHLWKYFLGTFTAEGFGYGYFDAIRFVYLLRLLPTDPQIFLGLGICLYRALTPKGRSPQELALTRGAVLLAIALFLHPEKLPFFIYSCVPFFTVAIFASRASALKFCGWLDQQKLVRIGVVALVTVLWARSLSDYMALREYANNIDQVEAMNVLQDHFRDQRHLTIYDPVGIMPFFDGRLWYLGPGNREEHQVTLEVLSRYLPDVILYAQRLQWLEPQVYEFIKLNYLDWGKGVFVRRLKLVAPQKDPTLAASAVVQQIQQAKPQLQDSDFVYFLPAVNPDFEGQVLLKSRGSDVLSPLRKITLGDLRRADRVVLLSQFPSVSISWMGAMVRGLPKHIIDLFRFDSEI